MTIHILILKQATQKKSII